MRANSSDGTTSSARTPGNGFPAILRAAAAVALVAGGIGSEGLMLYASRHNNSWILRGLYTLWVLAPFVALARAHASRRAGFSVVTLVIALISLAIYGEVALGPPMAKVGSVFLVVPLVSWLPIAVVVLRTRFGSGKNP